MCIGMLGKLALVSNLYRSQIGALDVIPTLLRLCASDESSPNVVHVAGAACNHQFVLFWHLIQCHNNLMSHIKLTQLLRCGAWPPTASRTAVK